MQQMLPAAQFPDHLVPYAVQHRFRAIDDGWPLIQLGPGIFTVNDTEKYEWKDFQTRTKAAVSKLFDAHPKTDEFKVENLLLRYINEINFDYRNEDVFDFLRNKLGITVGLPQGLFSENAVLSRSDDFSWHSVFPCKTPKGIVALKFNTGLRDSDKKPVLRWETMLVSIGGDLPEMPKDFDDWFFAAHNVLEDWFFKLIAGGLEAEFNK